MQRMNKIDDCLNLSPIIKDYIDYQLLEQDQEKGKYTIKSGMNFITWLWWSGKTFFIEETLKYLKEPKDHLWETKDYLWERKFIRIDFSPRNLETTASIYSHFLDTFISGLLSEKYDPNLKGYKSNLLKILGAWTGNNYLDMFFKLFNSPSENVQDILKSINNSLQTTYKDCFVVVVIDDIDRVEKKDLLNIGKILNLLKNLTSIQKKDKDKNKSDPNLICLYSADSNYLNNFYLWDRQEENAINFYQYFNKFRDSQIDIYEATYKSLITFLKDSILEIKDNERIQSKLDLCNKLFDSLKEKDTPVTIRDLLFLKKEILEKFQQNIDKAKKEFNKHIDIILPEKIKSYFYLWEDRLNIFFLYLYIKSLHEKDSHILLDLQKEQKYFETNNWDGRDTIQEQEAIEVKRKHSFIFDNLYKSDLRVVSYKRDLKMVTNRREGDNKQIDIILDYFLDNIWTDMGTPYFKQKRPIEKISNILFKRFNNRETNLMDDIFWGILGDNLFKINSWDNMYHFIKNYITISSHYINNIKKISYEDIINIDENFWITTFKIFNYFDNSQEVLNFLTNLVQWKRPFFPLYLIGGLNSFAKENKNKSLIETIKKNFAYEKISKKIDIGEMKKLFDNILKEALEWEDIKKKHWKVMKVLSTIARYFYEYFIEDSVNFSFVDIFSDKVCLHLLEYNNKTKNNELEAIYKRIHTDLKKNEKWDLEEWLQNIEK